MLKELRTALLCDRSCALATVGSRYVRTYTRIELMLPFAPREYEALEFESPQPQRRTHPSAIYSTRAIWLGRTAAGNRGVVDDLTLTGRRLSTPGAGNLQQQFDLRSIAVVT